MANYISAHYVIALETGFQAKRLAANGCCWIETKCYLSYYWSHDTRTHAHPFQLHLSLCLRAAEYGCDLLLWYVRFRQFDCKLEIACAYLSLGIQDGLIKLFFHGNIWDLHSFTEFSAPSLNHVWRIIPHQWTMQLWNIQLLYTCSRTFSIRFAWGYVCCVGQ